MNIQSIFYVLIASNIMCSCGSSSNTTATSTVPMMTGAYTSAETSAPDIVACANFAVDSREPKGTVKLVRILAAEKQVVAGMNYKLKLAVTENDTAKTVSVVVWSKLDGTKEVTSYE